MHSFRRKSRQCARFQLSEISEISFPSLVHRRQIGTQISANPILTCRHYEHERAERRGMGNNGTCMSCIIYIICNCYLWTCYMDLASSPRREQQRIRERTRENAEQEVHLQSPTRRRHHENEGPPLDTGNWPARQLFPQVRWSWCFGSMLMFLFSLSYYPVVLCFQHSFETRRSTMYSKMETSRVCDSGEYCSNIDVDACTLHIYIYTYV